MVIAGPRRAILSFSLLARREGGFWLLLTTLESGFFRRSKSREGFCEGGGREIEAVLVGVAIATASGVFVRHFGVYKEMELNVGNFQLLLHKVK